MSVGSTTIQEAIYFGLKTIALPSKIIIILTTTLCVVLLITDFSLGDLLIIPLGILMSILYTSFVTPRWKIWAYERVVDINQFQRSAELAGLLTRQSYEKNGCFLSKKQIQILENLRKRFTDEARFEDDLSILNETIIYRKSIFPFLRNPIMTLSDSKITVQSKGDFTWEQINEERIIQISYNRMNARTSNEISSGTKDFFRFECDDQTIEVPFSLVDIEVWKLDLLIYIYKGRFELIHNLK